MYCLCNLQNFRNDLIKVNYYRDSESELSYSLEYEDYPESTNQRRKNPQKPSDPSANERPALQKAPTNERPERLKKRESFKERLKASLARGNTPDPESGDERQKIII